MVFSMKLNFCQLNRVKNGLNAVSILAQLGDEEQVLNLLSAGGNLGDAVYGYALGGHVNKVNAILKTHPDLLVHAAKGYARGENEIETEKLATSSEIALKKALLEGYAQAANTTQINAAVRSKNKVTYMPAIVAGLAQCGHSHVLLDYAINEELQNVAITAAALSGNVTLVNELLARQNIFSDQLSQQAMEPGIKTALGHALVGYSKGRHYEHVEELLKLNINPMLCLTAISDKESIHPSDIQSLTHHIADESLRESLLKLIEEHFGSKPGEKEMFSDDSELERLLEHTPVKSEVLSTPAK